MKPLPVLAAAALTVLLPSCIMPRIFSRSPAVTGTVIDARTRQPVRGASISLATTTWPTAKSKADGRFTLPESRAAGAVVGLGCAREIGNGDHYADVLVQKERYTPLRLELHRLKRTGQDTEHLDAGTVLLVPEGAQKPGAPVPPAAPAKARSYAGY